MAALDIEWTEELTDNQQEVLYFSPPNWQENCSTHGEFAQFQDEISENLRMSGWEELCANSGISGKEPLPNLMDDVSKASTMQDKNRTIKDGIAQFEPTNWREAMED